MHPIIDVPQQLLLELAVGLDSFDDVCARYEYTPEMTAQLRRDPGVNARVARLAQELKNDGVTFRVRSAHAAEDLVGVIWAEAKRTDTPLATKLAAAQFLARMGDLEPKPSAAPPGSRFSITIELPTSPSSANNHHPTPVIDVSPQPVAPTLVLPQATTFVAPKRRGTPRRTNNDELMAMPEGFTFD